MSNPNDGLFEFASSLVRAQATAVRSAPCGNFQRKGDTTDCANCGFGKFEHGASRTDDTAEAAAAIESAADRLVSTVEPSMLRMMLLAGEFTYKMQERGKSWLEIEAMLRDNFKGKG